MKALGYCACRRLFGALALLLALGAPAIAQPATDPATDIVRIAKTIKPVIAKNGMVTSQDAIATRVGVDVLEKGGHPPGHERPWRAASGADR